MILEPSGDPFIGETCKKLSNEFHDFVLRQVATSNKKLSPLTQYSAHTNVWIKTWYRTTNIHLDGRTRKAVRKRKESNGREENSSDQAFHCVSKSAKSGF